MPRRKISKSFSLDSEPVLRWPKSPAKVKSLKGYTLEYSGGRMEYTLRAEETGSVVLVGWTPKLPFAAWRDVFLESELKPSGLMRLAQLSFNPTYTQVSEWVSQNGLLGFRPTNNPVVNDEYSIPVVSGDVAIHYYEPIRCIVFAAKRAANVLALWSALKKSYAIGGGSNGTKAIRSIITFEEDIRDSSKAGAVAFYPRAFVNGEYRGLWPIPESPRGWRRLATLFLSKYIQEHIFGQIEVAVGIQWQNRDAGERNVEPPSDWNLKPTWKIQSALGAYYVELLMVMRRFRTCETCQKDISHQREESIYCSAPSTCRTKQWHRKNTAKRRPLSAVL